ncbi:MULTISPECIES: hypothetical protein [unclassified Microcoleus]|uniref:hypothetical protein n=1 Tax=unclassified Microcoleus TaxID=2642155 RepID=UPI002FD0DBEC
MLPNILSDDLDRIEQAIQLSSLKVPVLNGDLGEARLLLLPAPKYNLDAGQLT